MSPSEQQPPFPQPVVDPAARKPPAKHPNAEALLNAAAKHVFPESEQTKVPPTKAENHPKSGVTREGRVEKGDEDSSKRDREEEPIVAGTPLDEMTPMETPMQSGSGSGGFPFTRPRKATSELMGTTIPEGEAVNSGLTAGEEEFSVKAVRPGFGAGKEIGSVSLRNSGPSCL